MRPENIQIGTRYRNPRIDKLVGKVIYLGVGEPKNNLKGLVIIEGAGVGTFVKSPIDTTSKRFWDDLMTETEYNTSQKSLSALMVEVLFRNRRESGSKYAARLNAVAKDVNMNLVIRNTAKRLAETL
jgi:hypothetical protein